MTAYTESLNESYTRKVGGEQYTYLLEYTTGRHVNWQAQVFRDGEKKGSPGGDLSENALSGTELRQTLVTLVEVTIENMIGIAE